LPRCEWVREVAPDLALGLLTGQDRGDALAHLERCEGCRAEVAALSGTADEILLAAPEATPPAGFDRRVLAAVEAHRGLDDDGPGATAPAPRRGPARRPGTRMVALVAAAVVLVVAGVAAAVLRNGTADDGRPGDGDGGGGQVAAAEMRTGRGRPVGEVTLTGDHPVAVTVDVPEWDELVERWEDEPAGGYWLAVETRDGERTVLPMTSDGGDDPPSADGDLGSQAGGTGPYGDGRDPEGGHDDRGAGGAGGWTVTVDAARDEVATVSVVDAEGRTWCSGTFPA
ncbi:MAG TPA: hypothetical protein VFY82_13100, partial [Acidimicrobiales bacterium]|nr:hypothetical protein [Acidimicrobiales bacterium]